MAEQITLADLNRIYVVVPSDFGTGTVNLTVAQMTDRQFRAWIQGKADYHGVPLIVPAGGRIGFETRVNLLNKLVQAGVRIYMTPAGPGRG